MRSTAFLILLAIATTCGSCASREPVMTPPPAELGNPTLSKWDEIHTTRVVDGNVVREKLGYLELRYKRNDGPDSGQEFIYGQDPNIPLGFRSPSGKTFQYTERREQTPTSSEIGRWQLDRAIRHMLGLDEDAQIEFVPVR